MQDVFILKLRKDREVRMRVWLLEKVYKSFPMVVGAVGFLGCIAGSTASISLGGMLILYSGGVYCMRR